MNIDEAKTILAPWIENAKKFRERHSINYVILQGVVDHDALSLYLPMKETDGGLLSSTTIGMSPAPQYRKLT